MSFAKQQPKDGETILHCGHVLDSQRNHFFMVTKVIFTRPDNSKGSSRWIVLCDPCFSRNAEHPEQCIRADSQWIGNEPAIKDMSS